MADIFDYITWRGELSFRLSPLNCVDALIFSQMAYFPFDNLWNDDENGTITLREAYERLQQDMDAGGKPYFHMPKDRKLFPAMALSRRYGDLKLRSYVNQIDKEQEKQFAAVTVRMPEGAFIAYRGTDNTLVGWKEDFNMTFTTPVPAQKDALKYFAGIAAAVPGKIWLGGHSKGGNLAMYAGMFCDETLRQRIAAIYSNDGPGFSSLVVTEGIFQRLEGILHSFVPQSSIVGMLMEQDVNHTVVHSRQIGPLQHDLYSWDIDGTDFVRLNSLKTSSLFLDKTLQEWFGRLDPDQRKQFVDSIFKILTSTNAASLDELKRNLMRNTGIILKEIRNLDPETRKMVLETMRLLRKSVHSTLPQFLPKPPWKG